MRRPRIVLFDLGGVLVELGGVADFGAMIGESDPTRVFEHWLTSRWVREYESGRIASQEFSARMVAEYGLSMPPEEFLARFDGWPVGLSDGAVELVQRTAARVATGCLSNTNASHWAHQRDGFGLAALFPVRFLSFEIGHVKPDPEIYWHVLDVLALAPSDVLFLDDNRLNVEGARTLGIDAHLCRGVAEAEALLDARGLLG